MKEIIINLAGSLDAVNGSDLYLKIKELVVENPHKIVMDFSALQQIDETGMIFLQKAKSRIEQNSLAAVCVADTFSRYRELAGIFPVFPDRKSAIEFLNSPPTEEEETGYCPVCGVGMAAPNGDLVCSGCGSRLYVQAGKITAFERLF